MSHPRLLGPHGTDVEVEDSTPDIIVADNLPGTSVTRSRLRISRWVLIQQSHPMQQQLSWRATLIARAHSRQIADVRREV